MDISSIVSNASSSRTDPAIGIAVLKKALDITTTNAAMLLDAIPSAPSVPNLPANLGKNINTTA